MFKLKPGNVFQKANSMYRKQAYTWGAVAVVFVVALITLSSFMGGAQDDSFNGLDSRGYDLAQMPFVNDEAEQYLLSSKYPDMQGNNSTLLYSAAQKEERQAQDAQAEQDAQEDTSGGNSSGYSSSDDDDSSRSTRGYRGRSYSGSGGTASPTQVNKLGSGSMGHASGSGVSGSWGAPRGDFSPYKSQDKGNEQPVQFKNQDARKALYQFARGSQAAARLKEGKSGNVKRAMMGGEVKGAEACGDDGAVDLSKVEAQGLAIDTEAPASPDLSNLEKELDKSGQKAKEKAEQKQKDLEKSLEDKFWEALVMGAVDVVLNFIGKAGDAWIDSWDFGKSDTKTETK